MKYGKVSICEIIEFVRIFWKEQYLRGLLVKAKFNCLWDIQAPLHSNPSKFDLGLIDPSQIWRYWRWVTKSDKTNSEKKNSRFFFFFFSFNIRRQKRHNGLMYSCTLPYGSPYLQDKIIFWAFLCLGLKFSSFSAQNVNFSHLQYGFWGTFARI